MGPTTIETCATTHPTRSCLFNLDIDLFSLTISSTLAPSVISRLVNWTWSNTSLTRCSLHGVTCQIDQVSCVTHFSIRTLASISYYAVSKVTIIIVALNWRELANQTISFVFFCPG